VIESLQFPASWRQPSGPGYGTFPFPFVVGALTYAAAARGAQQYVEQALCLGYRHIDTAFSYRNQDLLGAAVRAVGLPRQQVFVTSKLHPSDNSHDGALLKIQEAIRLIWNTPPLESGGYLDAFLLHYPGLRDPVAAWRALLEARAQGWIKHAGVSNFEVRYLEALRASSGQYPELNQIEFHPHLYAEQKDLLSFCRSNGIAVEAYSPLAEGAVLEDAEVRATAEAHRTSAARVALRWCMQHGARPIVGTRNPSHLKANAEPYAFTLNPDEMARLDSLSLKKITRVSLKWNWNPRTAPLGSSTLKRAANAWIRRLAGALRPG
jgi:diketogulonate reductase-like aldo/keto reductase